LGVLRMKYVIALSASLSFLIVLVSLYFVQVNYLPVNVVFYAAIGTGVVAAAITGVGLFVFRPFRIMNRFEKTQLIAMWLLVGYALAISVPTVIDRSLSFYILEKLQQRGGGIALDRFESVFTEEYMREHRLVDVRLTEQLESGTITIEDGCVRLTQRGERLASFGRFFRTHWLPKTRLLMGEYTDALTDPFRDSTESFDYHCEPSFGGQQ